MHCLYLALQQFSVALVEERLSKGLVYCIIHLLSYIFHKDPWSPNWFGSVDRESA